MPSVRATQFTHLLAVFVRVATSGALSLQLLCTPLSLSAICYFLLPLQQRHALILTHFWLCVVDDSKVCWAQGHSDCQDSALLEVCDRVRIHIHAYVHMHVDMQWIMRVLWYFKLKNFLISLRVYKGRVNIILKC